MTTIAENALPSAPRCQSAVVRASAISLASLLTIALALVYSVMSVGAATAANF